MRKYCATTTRSSSSPTPYLSQKLTLAQPSAAQGYYGYESAIGAPTTTIWCTDRRASSSGGKRSTGPTTRSSSRDRGQPIRGRSQRPALGRRRRVCRMSFCHVGQGVRLPSDSRCSSRGIRPTGTSSASRRSSRTRRPLLSVRRCPASPWREDAGDLRDQARRAIAYETLHRRLPELLLGFLASSARSRSPGVSARHPVAWHR